MDGELQNVEIRDNRVIDIFWDRVNMGSFGGKTDNYREEGKKLAAKMETYCYSF